MAINIFDYHSDSDLDGNIYNASPCEAGIGGDPSGDQFWRGHD